MVPFLLQDWLTLQGPSLAGSSPITQSEFAWLDMSGYLDLVTWLQVSEISAGNYYCAFQTAPTKDESLFTAMNDVSVATGTPMALGVQVGVYLRDTALCPLSQWLRWQIIPPASTAWNMTFRIWVSANAPGGLAREHAAGAAGASAGGPSWVPGVAAGSTAPGSAWSPLAHAVAKTKIGTSPPVTPWRPDYGASPGVVDTTRRHQVSKTDIRPHAFGIAGQGRHVYTTVHPVAPGANFNPNIGPRAPVEKK